jgi:O-antigen/teichoic acid export membrane protein
MLNNISNAMVTKIFILAAGFLFSILLARVTSIEVVGDYFFFISLTMTLSFILDFGCNSSFFKSINQSFSREEFNISRYRAKSLLDYKLSISIISLCFILIFYLQSNIFGAETEQSYVWIVVISGLLMSIQLSFSTIDRAKGAFFKSQLYYELLPNLFRLSFVLLFVVVFTTKIDFYLLSLVYLTSLLLPLIFNLYSERSTLKFVRINFKLVKKVVTRNYDLTWFALILYIHPQLDLFLLKYLSDSADVGGYGVANRISTLFAFATMVTNVVVPNFVGKYISTDSKRDLLTLFKKFIIIMSILTIVQYIFLYSIGSQLMLLWGDEYVGYFDIVLFLCIGQSAMIVTSIASHITFLGNMQFLNTISVTFCLLLNLVLNIYFIPLYGATGAAIGTMISFITLAVLKLCGVFYFFFKNNYFEAINE